MPSKTRANSLQRKKTGPVAGAETKRRPAVRTPPPPALIEVALIDAKACAATGCMGVSWWYAEVAAKRAPQPVIREPRCSRWRLVDVRKFWADRAERSADQQAAEVVARRVSKASAAAQTKRQAAQRVGA